MAIGIGIAQYSQHKQHLQGQTCSIGVGIVQNASQQNQHLQVQTCSCICYLWTSQQEDCLPVYNLQNGLTNHILMVALPVEFKV